MKLNLISANVKALQRGCTKGPRRLMAMLCIASALSVAAASGQEPATLLTKQLAELITSLAKLAAEVRELRTELIQQRLDRQDETILALGRQLENLKGEQERLDEEERSEGRELQELNERLSQAGLRGDERLQLGNGGEHERIDREAQPRTEDGRPKHAHGIFHEAHHGIPDGSNDALLEIRQTADVVDDRVSGDVIRERVDGKVPPKRVFFRSAEHIVAPDDAVVRLGLFR